MNEFTIDDLLTKRLENVGDLYSQLGLDKNPHSELANVYNKLVESTITVGNIYNTLKLLKASKNPDMIGAIKSCIKYAPEGCKRSCFEKLMRRAGFQKNREFTIPYKTLINLDKRGILNKERKIVEESKQELNNLSFRIDHFIGLYSNDSVIPLVNYGIAGNKTRKEIVKDVYCEEIERQVLAEYDRFLEERKGIKNKTG